MYREPATWHALMEKLTEQFARYVAAQARAGADVVQLFDSWVGVLSPADYAEFVEPYSARILAAVDVPTIHFGTGATEELLALLARAGGDVVGVDWRLPLAAAPADRAVQGNLEPAVLFGPWERIERRRSRCWPPARAARTSSTSGTASCREPTRTCSRGSPPSCRSARWRSGLSEIPREELELVLGATRVDEVEDLRGAQLCVGGGRLARPRRRPERGAEAAPPERRPAPEVAVARGSRRPVPLAPRAARLCLGRPLSVRRPRLLARVDRPDGDVALWLENGGDPHERRWTPELLAAAARRLGAAQRELLGVDEPWLAHGWLREYFRLHELPLDDGVLDRLDRIPQTLCHNDFHPDNVLDSGLLIDWAYCGVGPVGMDAGSRRRRARRREVSGRPRRRRLRRRVARLHRGLRQRRRRRPLRVRPGDPAARWLDRDRSPASAATIDFIDGLGSDG